MRVRQCKTCGGTGLIWSLRSWFTHDGYYGSRCGYCGPDGGRTDAGYEKFQRLARERIKADPRWRSQTGANEIGREAGIAIYQIRGEATR